MKTVVNERKDLDVVNVPNTKGIDLPEAHYKCRTLQEM